MGEQETQEVLDQYAKLGKAGAKGAAKAGKKVAKKALNKGTKKLASTAAKSVVSSLANAIGSALLAVLPYIAIPLLVIIVAAGAWYIGRNAYSKVAGDYEKETLPSGYVLVEDWNDRLLNSYYARFSDSAYYYTIDDDPTLKQGGIKWTNSEWGIVRGEDKLDKYKREGSFALSTTLLKFLDEQLNNNITYPQQFIKPIYNTCSTGESTDGKCELKEILDDSNGLISPSQNFKLNSNNLYSLSGTETSASVSDWGLAPILHYKKYEEEKYVKNFDISEITYWSDEENNYITCKKSKCPEDIVKSVQQADGDIGKEKINRSVTHTYLIDQVATFIGTIKNDIEAEERDTGDDYVREGKIEKWSSSKTLKNFSGKDKNRAESSLISEETKKILEDTTIKKIIQPIKEEIVVYVPDDERAIDQENYHEFFPEIFEWISGDFGPKDFYLSDSDSHLAKVYESRATGDIKDGITQFFEGLGNKIDDFVNSLPFIGKGKKEHWKFYTSVEIETQNDRTMTCMSVSYKDGYFYCNDNGQHIKVNLDDDIAETQVDSHTGKELPKYQYNYYRVFYQQDHSTTYTLSGDKWSKEYVYKSENPEIEDFNNGKYIEDYINNYEVFIPIDADADEEKQAKEIPNVKDYIDDMKKFIENKNSMSDEEKQIFNIDLYENVVTMLYGEAILGYGDDPSIAFCEDNDCSELEQLIEEDNDINKGQGIKRSTSGENTIKQKLAENKNLKDFIKDASADFGIPEELLEAIAMQESTLTHNGIANEGSYTNGTGVGVMQIKYSDYRNSTISALNIRGEVVSIHVTWANINDLKTNVYMGAILLRNLIDKYEGNALLAIQAYNQGTGAVDAILNTYSSMTNISVSSLIAEPTNLGWSNNAYTSKYAGDAQYLTHVLQYFYADNLTYSGKNYSGQISIAINDLKMEAASSGMTLEQQIDWQANRALVLAMWKLLYPTKSSVVSIPLVNNRVYNNPDKDYVHINSYFASNDTARVVIANFFASEDNGEVQDYFDITEDMWREKFSSMFAVTGSQKLTLQEKDWQNYFSTMPNSPIQYNYTISRAYGIIRYINSQNINASEKFTDIIMIDGGGTEIRPVDSGVVVEMSTDSVTIRHTPLIKPKEDNAEYTGTVETVYKGMKVDGDIYIGKSVTQSTVLGRFEGNSIENLGELTFSLIVNNMPEDPTWIISLAKRLDEYERKEANHNALGQANETTKEIQAYLLAHADEIEEEYFSDSSSLFNPDKVNISESFNKEVGITSIAWTRDGTSASGSHQGVDISSLGDTDTGIYTLDRGILVAFYDGYPDTGMGSNSYNENWGMANYVQMLYKGNNDHWYSISYAHCKQGGEIHLTAYKDNPILEKNTRIATVGNSGASLGYHTHVQVHDLGTQSLKSIIEFLSQYQGRYGSVTFNLEPYAPGNHCENNATTPCWYKPHIFFNVSYGGHYQGVAGVS